VRLVAARCGLPDELGVKGQSGVLASMPNRAAFLSDPTHRIRFVYVPKHTSWLNQVEIWLAHGLTKDRLFRNFRAQAK